MAPRFSPPHLTHVSCAFGGTGVSHPDDISVTLYFDLAASDEMSGVRVDAIEVVDASGATVSRLAPPIELHVSLPGRDRDHNLMTMPFLGSIDAGATVRLCAVAGPTRIASASRAKLRYRMILGTSESERGTPLVLEGALDAPWATAGPTLG